MKIKFIRAILIIAYVFPIALFSQGIADTTKLEKSISILNGKTYFRFPAGAVVSPRVADIMAADPNINRETRIIYDLDTMKLVFFAQEIFVLSGDDLYETMVRQEPEAAEFRRKSLLKGDSIEAVLTTPLTFDSTAGGILVNSLLIRNPDNTVYRFDAFINPSAYHLKDEYIALTEKVFMTATKGNRRTDLAAKEDTYKLPGRENKIAFKLPKNYVVTTDEKYDFIVYKINKYKDIADTGYTSITVYAGSHPSYFHAEYELDVSKASKIKGKALQQDVEWLLFEEPQNSFFLKEQVIPLDHIEKGFVMHIAIISNQKKLIDELTNVVTGAKIIN